MDDQENEKLLYEKYPLHIVLMVRAAVASIDAGRARLEDGVLVISDVPAEARLPRTKRHLPNTIGEEA